MTKSIEKEILVRKINYFCNERKEIKASTTSISAWDLVGILKDYYQELYDLFDEESPIYQELLDEINKIISPDYISVLKKKNSSFSFSQIRLIVKDSLIKIIDNNYKLRGIKCDDIKVAIGQNVSAIKLSIHENYELKPIVICRDIEAGQLYLAENSYNNEQLIDKIRCELVNIFDIIDSYRATIPRLADININEDVFDASLVNNGNKYVIEFDDDAFKGRVEVLYNGKINYSLMLKSESEEYELSKTIRIEEIMSKIPIDIASLKDPIKSIILSSFEKEYSVPSREIKVI